MPRIFHAKTAYQAVLTQLSFFGGVLLETKQSDDPCRKNRAKLEGRRKGGAESNDKHIESSNNKKIK